MRVKLPLVQHNIYTIKTIHSFITAATSLSYVFVLVLCKNITCITERIWHYNHIVSHKRSIQESVDLCNNLKDFVYYYRENVLLGTCILLPLATWVDNVRHDTLGTLYPSCKSYFSSTKMLKNREVNIPTYFLLNLKSHSSAVYTANILY